MGSLDLLVDVRYLVALKEHLETGSPFSSSFSRILESRLAGMPLLLS